jgi:DNA-binding MarR family transcriptional regulator
MDTFDPKRLVLKRSTMNPILEQSTVQNTRVPRHHANGHFLKGPIPLTLINQATRLPGKAWHVYAAIWYLVGINRHSTVNLTNTALKQFNVSRDSKYRALKALEKAGLLTVVRTNGKNSVVTLLDHKETESCKH